MNVLVGVGVLVHVDVVKNVGASVGVDVAAWVDVKFDVMLSLDVGSSPPPEPQKASNISAQFRNLTQTFCIP